MTSRFESYESIYWVFTHLCNDNCAHCYNDSSPAGEKLPQEECLAIVANLPGTLGRVILSLDRGEEAPRDSRGPALPL